MSSTVLNDKYTNYHFCIVRECKNTSIKTPGKLWIRVPSKTKMRNTWLKLAKRDPESLSNATQIFFCEDHFDLENDMENYLQYKLMGSVKWIRMKPDCKPTRFECQNDKKHNVISNNDSKVAENIKKQIRPKTTSTSPFKPGEASSMECKDDNEISFITIDDSPEAVEPKAAEPSPPPPALLCDECGLAFTGFIYECVQCGHRMCSACDHVGAHKDHYVLRIPADRPKGETDKMMSKVRAAIGVEKLSRPARDKDKARRVPQVSDSEPDEAADGTSEAEDTAMTVKMEVEVEEFDPLQARVAPAPALAADDARVNEVEVTIKSEPPDEESYSEPKCNSADPCDISWTMPTATTTIKREVDESEPGSSQQKKKRQKKGKADT